MKNLVLFSDNINDYLKSDAVIDYDNKEIMDLAERLFSNANGELAFIKAAYEFVRDNISHSADINEDIITCTASEVLNAGHGICFAKSHLLAALLRCKSVPAGFCYQKLALDDKTAPVLRKSRRFLLRKYRTGMRAKSIFTEDIIMNVLLTSCGLETERITAALMKMLTKSISEVKAMFIPTAANSPDAIEVLPKCLNDLLKIGVKRENIFVYDLHDALECDLNESYDIIYLCGGSSVYLLKRINEQGFNSQLLGYIKSSGIVIGVSAGSIIFANNIPDNLGLLKCALDVHCDDTACEKAGEYSLDRQERIKLGNKQAIIFDNNKIVVID